MTAWDAKTLEPAGRWEMKGSGKLLGAAISNDGSILVTMAEDHSVTLWKADTKQAFAILQPQTS